MRVEGGEIVIGAMTTQHEIIASEALHAAAPILRETALLIADPQVRYMGTIGGNAANGDPGNDMPALMMALDASYVLRSAQGRAARQGARHTTRAPTTPRRSPAKSSPPSASRRRRRATATPTKSSSAKSATTRPPPPPCC